MSAPESRTWMTATAAAAALDSGELSARELTGDLVERGRVLDPLLGAQLHPTY